MGAHRKDRHGELVPMIVAGLIAVVGTVSILWMDSGPDSNSQGSGDGMITASALSRSGAIALPTQPPAHLAIPKTVPVSELLTH
jgi:hypothetical protein